MVCYCDHGGGRIEGVTATVTKANNFISGIKINKITYMLTNKAILPATSAKQRMLFQK
jgi:hypothetical protein